VWRNWSGDQVCQPVRVERPGSTEDVVRVVQRAAAEGRVVRVAGAGHSFNDTVVTDGVLVSLDAMDRVLDADRSSGLVRVQAGIRLHALSDRLAEAGLGMENLGDINRQSLAGAVSTGTHGAGASLGNISSQVVAVQLVAGDGTVHELSEGDELRAARVALGALGVITEVTLRCVPLYALHGLDAGAPLSDVLDRLDELAGATRHFEFYVFPHTDIALTRTNEIVDEAPRPPGPGKRWAEDILFGNHALRAVCELAKRAPSRIPQINRAVARSFSKRVRVDRSDRIFSSPRLVRFTEMEQAFPREAAAEVIPEILATLERYPVVFPIEVRFVAPDDALISPAGGRETVYTAVHNFVGMPWEAPLRAVQAIGDRHAARPHWGKRHFHTAETLAPRYPEWETFQRIREQLDPDGRFANDYVGRTLIGQSIRDPASPALR
jgi:L-gulono-1,4-lactone dehydrogenase